MSVRRQKVLGWLSLLLVGGVVVEAAIFRSGGEGEREETTSKIRRSNRSFEALAPIAWRTVFQATSIPAGSGNRLATTPNSVPEPVTAKPVLRTVLLSDLSISPAFLARLSAESEVPEPTSSVVRNRTGVSKNGTGTSIASLASTSGSGAPSPGSYRLVSFVPGTTRSGKPIRTGFDLASLQTIVPFPPDYSLWASTAQTERVLPLGNGGEVTLEVMGGSIVDGAGADFVVFENPFIVNGTNGREVYVETAIVSVAEKDEPGAYTEFPCQKDEKGYPGCAGKVPVRYAAGLDLSSVGGDLFDLSDIGVIRARFIRIRDTGDNLSFMEGTEGFDLDAVGLIHTETAN
ncbi:MAG: hypothetical protein V1495_03080 [Pseudomonadota bacterium]